jgi:hypothetical protein
MFNPYGPIYKTQHWQWFYGYNFLSKLDDIMMMADYHLQNIFVTIVCSAARSASITHVQERSSACVEILRRLAWDGEVVFGRKRAVVSINGEITQHCVDMYLFKKIIFSIFNGKYRTLLPSEKQSKEQFGCAVVWRCSRKGALVEKDGGRRNGSVWLRCRNRNGCWNVGWCGG